MGNGDRKTERSCRKIATHTINRNDKNTLAAIAKEAKENLEVNHITNEEAQPTKGVIGNQYATMDGLDK